MSSTGQIVVVGAGAAGIAAAHASASSGASVVLIDEQDGPGGWLRSSIQEIPDAPEMIAGKRGFEASRYALDLVSSSSIDYRPLSTVWGLFEGRRLGVIGPDGAYQLNPSKIILATGSTEIVWPFRGWTLPGVMTARAARTMMHRYFVIPGRRVAVVGRGPDADQMIKDLELAGVLEAHRIETPDSHVASGRDAVNSVAQDGDSLEVDAIILALGSLPDPELARHGMADLSYSEADGCHVPVRDPHMGTSAEDVYVVGDAGGLTTVAEAVAQGFVAGYSAVESEKLAGAMVSLTDFAGHRSPHKSVGDPAQIADDVQVDREEQITAGRIREAIDTGAVSVNDVKRKTRAGMGLSQGRDTEYVIARMISARTGIPLTELVPMTARPPARLVPLAELARIAATTG